MAETFKPAIFAKLGERITTLIKPKKLSSAVTFVRSAGENSTSQNSKKVAKVMSGKCTRPCRSFNLDMQSQAGKSTPSLQK